MAETNRKRKTESTPAKKKTGTSGARTTVTTAHAKSPSTRQSDTDTRKKTASKKQSHDQNPERGGKNKSFSLHFLPYILGGVSLFLIVCLLFNAFGNKQDDIGYVGYYLCRILFGIIGWPGYLLPAALIYLTIFWRRYHTSGKVVGKVILTASLVLLLSGITHVFICQGNAGLRDVYSPVTLFETGAEFHSGGVLGGWLGFLLYWALRLPGTIVLAIVAIPLIIMCLVGVTPADVFGRLWRSFKKSREKSKEARAQRAAEEKAEQKRVKANAAASRDEYDEYGEAEDEEDDASGESVRPISEKGMGRTTRKQERSPAEEDPEDSEEDVILQVNRKTGEVLNDTSSVTRNRRKDGKAESTPTERRYEPLPLSDPSPRRADPAPVPEEDEEDDMPWSREIPAVPARSTVETVETVAERAPVLKTTGQPTSNNREDVYDSEVDSMEVGFDDDTDDAAGMIPTEGARRVSYEVVNDEGVTTGVGRSSEPVTVRILKSETGAVDERGLSEEEIVLPSTTQGEDVPAEPAREYQFPSIDMLTRGPSRYEANEEEIAENTQILREVLESFRIGVREISCSCGPTITRFEVKPDTGVRVRSIANLVDDIAMGLAKAGVRIEAPIPGKSAVGIEVPNAEPSMVYLRNILEAPEFRNHKSRIAACLGADVSGRPVILDINKMPHLLIAGATGTGKSVCINSLIMSILYKAKPDEVKLILIDPKKVEFAMYRDLPHLYAPVVSDPKKAAGALNSAVNEMERRFELIEEVGVRNLAGYNEITAGDPERPPLPQMVIIIDELADLMMTAPAEVETAICRLAQKARAAGIHLIIGTQRPSVDVITGLIKANVPSRIAFTVKSGVDSRTILDTVGADKLIGRGDMLYAPIGCNKPIRAQGCFVSETEVEKVVTYIKEHNDGPVYNEDFARSIDLEAAKCGKKKGEQMSLDDFDGIGGGAGRNDGEDPKFWEALEIVVTKDKIGTSALQRGCNLGYGRAAKIIDRMEELGFVGPDPGTKQGRKVMITKQELIQYKLNGLPTSGGGADDDGAEGEF